MEKGKVYKCTILSPFLLTLTLAFNLPFHALLSNVSFSVQFAYHFLWNINHPWEMWKHMAMELIESVPFSSLWNWGSTLQYWYINGICICALHTDKLHTFIYYYKKLMFDPTQIGDTFLALTKYIQFLDQQRMPCVYACVFVLSLS